MMYKSKMFPQCCLKINELRQILFLWISLLSALNAEGSSVKDLFTDSNNPGTFQHLVVDIFTGRVYIGATNRFYQLSPSLRLETSVMTGPKEDNPNCPPPSSECQCFGSSCKEFEKIPTNSTSKSLVIDYRGERIISCVSLFQGHCDKHLLRNITLTDPAVWTMLVPNDESSSIVMFIAPGPPNPASTDVLYVAASRSTKGLPAYKDIVPAVCMRNLQDLNFVSDDILTPSRIDIEVQQRDLFRVNYVYGFGSLGFSYFLTVQKISAITDSEKYVTQISRICQNDKSLYSYTEIPLDCHHRGIHYNFLRTAYVSHPSTDLAKSLGLPHIAPLTDMEHMLVAVFSNQSQSKVPSASTTMCIYPLRDIRRKFTETIQKCFYGLGNTGPDHFVQPKACFKTPFEIGDDYCGQHDINHPIKGMEPVSREAVIVWPNSNVTAIAVTVTSDFTVSFVGTEDGHLKKVVIESSESATEYDSILVQRNTRINQDMAFDHLMKHIYVMTDRKVIRIPVQDCTRYSTCSECLGAKDPFCGWCSLERRCSQKSDCSLAESSSNWLPYNTGLCTRIIKMASVQAQKQSASTSLVIMTVQNLPMSSSGSYQCSFSGYGVTRSTNVMQIDRQEIGNSTLKCETPTSNLLPPFPTGKDHIVMTLSLVSNGQDFLSTNFTFFDCSLHSTCTKCTSSDFPCTWCVERDRCTSNREECQSDVLVTGRRVRGKSDMPGPRNCPRIENDGNSSEILIPSGSEVGLKIMALHLQDFQTMFKCYFNFNGGEERNAQLLRELNGDMYIECDAVLFQNSGSSRYINVPFSIRWGELANKALDNPHNIQVRVFKCSEMASNCGRCRSIDVKHGCGWCSRSKLCSTSDQCAGSFWLERDKTCPDPVISTFHPNTGPLEGGTRVNVTGENLGLGKGDTAVVVAGVACNILHYEPSIWFVCETSLSINQSSGPILVTIADRYTALSLVSYSYVHPVITGFLPTIGPRSGGTHLMILGQNLNAGSVASITLSNGSQVTLCIFMKRLSDYAICTMSQTPFVYEANSLLMMVDDALIAFSGLAFNFVEDPIIDAVMPEKSIFSGGTKINVRGKRLGAVSSPRMIIHVEGQNITSLCELVSSEEMNCIAPNLHKLNSALVPNLSPDVPLSFHYGFIMDDVEALTNLTSPEVGNHLFQIYPDPVFEEFEGRVKQFFSSKNEYLTINGRYLNLALNEKDIQVTISDLDCLVTSVSSTQLTCLPSDQPTSLNTIGKVSVHVGNNTSYFIGDLKYEGSPQSFLMTMPFIIGIAGGAAVLLAIIIIICLAYRRKSRESNRVKRRMKNQMDVLEARVAKECKEAFAELQTDMTEVTSDISGPGGIPFREYHSFCMRVLFPGVPGNEHPVMRPLDTDLPSTEAAQKGLLLFNELIGNKNFLLLFIRTLEQHENFIVREKVNVASLLSVALQNRMDYHTVILKTLLAELIGRAVEGRYHPKLLLRRTESVAEKMLTNWFTFLLYKFLRESAGEPLFLLFRAIKQQVEKGPIDCLTSEAKYSLSEDKLIRQQVDYKAMTLHILDPEIQMMQEYSVKVLDCDSISQVKEKILDAIYRNAPFSSRPNKDDLELEWRTGNPGFVPLRDEDLTTKQDGEFKQLNTLAHYRVPDGSLMALTPRQTPFMVNLASSAEKIPQASRFDGFFSGSLPHSQSLSMSQTRINATHDYSSKHYHLVKSHEPDYQREGDRSSKMVSEIYLTRLLATKGTLQQFVDDLFETIFSTIHRGLVLPLAIKHLFDFLDDQAINHGITDPEVVHTWKSNSLPLRFWVNVIKNPDFVFDIFKSNIVDSCLSVVAQTFMDSCSMSEHKLSKDSPSSKLLYAKDIPKYKKWVERFYEDIQQMPSVSDQDMNVMLHEESRAHQNEFNTSAALYELYQYTRKYNEDLMQALDEDEFGRNYRLAFRLNQVHLAMDGEV